MPVTGQVELAEADGANLIVACREEDAWLLDPCWVDGGCWSGGDESRCDGEDGTGGELYD